MPPPLGEVVKQARRPQRLTLTGAVDTLVQEYLGAYPQHTEAVIELFWTAQQR